MHVTLIMAKPRSVALKTAEDPGREGFAAEGSIPERSSAVKRATAGFTARRAGHVCGSYAKTADTYCLAASSVTRAYVRHVSERHLPNCLIASADMPALNAAVAWPTRAETEVQDAGHRWRSLSRASDFSCLPVRGRSVPSRAYTANSGSVGAAPGRRASLTWMARSGQQSLLGMAGKRGDGPFQILACWSFLHGLCS